MYLPTAAESVFIVLAILAILVLHQFLQSLVYRHKTTRLNGPAAKSKVLGIAQITSRSPDPRALYESWVEKYGSVFRVHGPFHTERIVLCDRRAVAHVCAHDAATYSQTPTNGRLLSNIVSTLSFSSDLFSSQQLGEGNLFCLQDKDHKR